MPVTPNKVRTPRRLRENVDREHLRESLLNVLRAQGVIGSLLIAVTFFLIAAAILGLRTDVVDYRPGQHVDHDIVARVGFSYFDPTKLGKERDLAAQNAPHVYAQKRDAIDEIEQVLLALPERVKGKSIETVRADTEVDLSSLDETTRSSLEDYAESDRRAEWDEAIHAFSGKLRANGLLVLSDEDRHKDFARQIRLGTSGKMPYGENALSPAIEGDARKKLGDAASPLDRRFADKLVSIALKKLLIAPTWELDTSATAAAAEAARQSVPVTSGNVEVPPNVKFVDKGVINEEEYERLKAENNAYRAQSGMSEFLGLVGAALLCTIGLCAYIAKYQKRIVRNHGRGAVLAVMMLALLLVAELAGIGRAQLFFLGLAPTILIAMTLSIAYDQRFALGIATLHAAMVTLALGQPMSFFLVAVAGCLACVMTTHDLRSRSQLINIGGITGITLMIATFFAGLIHGDLLQFITTDALWAGVSGLGVGFFVSGCMPFVEKVFRISTGMSLLELADFGHPLLRKLASEAPGTYQHSMQVSVLAEEAANAIGANALLTRVGAYYHDVGKINKAEYFVENQTAGQQSRHIALHPNVSMLIIIGHVKDGFALAREYNLPTALFPFIQSHHGTTLVEYFFHRAQQQQQDSLSGDPTIAEIDEHQFRYQGPKPRSKEVAILMMADAAESACRTIEEPSAARIESLIHDILIKRLLDGQFDECDITMRELELVERSMIRTLIGIYHARIAYPSNIKDEPAEEDEIPERKTASAG